MSKRQTVYECVRIPAYGGESPNAYMPSITVELRIAWPPGLGHEQAVLDAIEEVAAAASVAVAAEGVRTTPEAQSSKRHSPAEVWCSGCDRWIHGAAYLGHDCALSPPQ